MVRKTKIRVGNILFSAGNFVKYKIKHYYHSNKQDKNSGILCLVYLENLNLELNLFSLTLWELIRPKK